jgi:Gpi18-like mannosyltransferase
MFKLLRNFVLFGFLYTGYKWLKERFGKTSTTTTAEKQTAGTPTEAA